MPSTLLLAPLDFQTLLRPWEGCEIVTPALLARTARIKDHKQGKKVKKIANSTDFTKRILFRLQVNKSRRLLRKHALDIYF